MLKFGRSQVRMKRMNRRLALLVMLLARTAVGFAGVLAAAATQSCPVADCNLLGGVFEAASRLELEQRRKAHARNLPRSTRRSPLRCQNPLNTSCGHLNYIIYK
jgi:hypothetical protein